MTREVRRRQLCEPVWHNPDCATSKEIGQNMHNTAWRSSKCIKTNEDLMWRHHSEKTIKISSFTEVIFFIMTKIEMAKYVKCHKMLHIQKYIYCHFKFCHKLCFETKSTKLRVGLFKGISGHFFANYINRFHKTEVLTVISMGPTCENLIWTKKYNIDFLSFSIL